MRRLAEELGISPSAICQHYPDRRALLRCVTHSHTDRCAASAPLIDVEAEVLLELEAMELDERKPVAAKSTSSSASIAPLVDLLDHAMRHGVLRKSSAVDVGWSLWAQAHGLVDLQQSGRLGMDRHSFDSFYRHCIHCTLERLRA